MNTRVIKRQQREEAILLSLKKLNYLSRSQIQRLHRLGSDRNARIVLKSMTEYLSYTREGEKVYYLNKEGRDRVQAQKVCKKTIQIHHYLMRNEAFIALGQPATWKNEVKFGMKGVGSIVADAVFQRGDLYTAIEIDYSQKMTINKSKVETYRALMRKNRFNLIWVTTTEYRRKQLAKLCEGMSVKIYTINDFK
ncbi:replication-relaxation family protein [Bacillus spongiae]|uniref:Replication-relaxation family protein n=1 Tax=Bacillus spongiae TaxID=2683610 RepID=A0ABU8H8T3_9BACI